MFCRWSTSPELRLEETGLWLMFPYTKAGKKNNSGKMSGKNEDKIIAMMLSNPSITIPEIAILLNVTERTIERMINSLKKKNMIARIGPRKGGQWKVMK